MLAQYPGIHGLRLDAMGHVDPGYWPGFMAVAGVFGVGEGGLRRRGSSRTGLARERGAGAGRRLQLIPARQQRRCLRGPSARKTSAKHSADARLDLEGPCPA